MRVRELIAELQKMNPNTRVVRDGYEGGVEDVTSVSEVRIQLHANDEWYYGSHEIKENGKAKATLIR